MQIQRQLTVFLENQPGMMAKICAIMKGIDVNILAFTLFGTVDHGVLRMIVDKPLEALHALGEKGVLVIDSEVLEIEAENRPGILQEIAAELSDARINVDYGYGSTGTRGNAERFYLQVSDSKKALVILKTRHIKNAKKAAEPPGRANPPPAARPRGRKKTSGKS